jgi:biotin carboxyl carrier protein
MTTKLKIRIESQWYLVEVVGDLNNDYVEVIINDEIFKVKLEEYSITTTEVSGPNSNIYLNSTPEPQGLVSTSTFTTPMPGSIIEILIKIGDHISNGDDICVLESMKMQQTLKADFDGDVIEILVSSGDQVLDGQGLINYS